MALPYFPTMMTLNEYITHTSAIVDAALNQFLPAETCEPQTIHKAMRYSIFAGGKRLRPVLCLAAEEACGGTGKAALPAACAVEMIHAYSLIHDDLPAMDNDDLRRGKPTNHKVFGEGIAILAGDALLTEAFAVITKTAPTSRYSTLDFVQELALTGGSTKLIGGQVLDLEGEHRPLSKEELIRIHEGKTAALLTTSLRFGAMTADADAATLDAITRFGYNLGIAFQIVDDILDVTASTEELGKTAGKDSQAEKATYVTVLGMENAQKEALLYTTAALDALDIFPANLSLRLREITEYLLKRKK